MLTSDKIECFSTTMNYRIADDIINQIPSQNMLFFAHTGNKIYINVNLQIIYMVLEARVKTISYKWDI